MISDSLKFWSSVGVVIFLVSFLAAAMFTPHAHQVYQDDALIIKVDIDGVSELNGRYVINGELRFIFKEATLPIEVNITSGKVVTQYIAHQDKYLLKIKYITIQNSTEVHAVVDVANAVQIPLTFDAIEIQEQIKEDHEHAIMETIGASAAMGTVIAVVGYVGDKRKWW